MQLKKLCSSIFLGDYFLRWRILARIRRFLRPTFLLPFPVFFVPTLYSGVLVTLRRQGLFEILKLLSVSCRGKLGKPFHKLTYKYHPPREFPIGPEGPLFVAYCEISESTCTVNTEIQPVGDLANHCVRAASTRLPLKSVRH